MRTYALLLLLAACRSDTGIGGGQDSVPAPNDSGIAAEDTAVSDTGTADTEDTGLAETGDTADTGTSDTSTSDSADTADSGPIDTAPPDADGDGSPDDVDCDDTDPSVLPGAVESCDGRDTNCVPDDEAAQCGCTTAEYGGHTYHFCNVHLDWAASRTACGLLASDLVVIDDAAENDFVSTATDSVNAGSSWWIGLSDATSEGSFTTTAGAAPAYTGFCPGEPNNSHGGECSTSSAENCVVLDWCSAGGWNDLPCDCVWDHIGFVCER